MAGPTGAMTTFEVSVCLGDFDCFCPAGSQPDPVPPGGECRYDCDCAAGLSCQGWYGIDHLHWGCARSCSVDADCAGWERCLFALDGPYGQCAPMDDLPADCSTVDCAPGYACQSWAGVGAWCQPDLSLSGSGHPCADDCECDAGLRCLDAGFGESAFCGLPCRGELDCPVGAICGQEPAASGSLPVCYLLEL
jgi:hypothetical protein